MNEPIHVTVPFENVNDPTAKIVEWKIASGSSVKAGDSVVELETTKTTFSVSAPADGFVEYNLPLGEEVPVGGDLFRIHINELSARILQTSPTYPPAIPAPVGIISAKNLPMISKRAQELITVNGIDPSVFEGMSVVKESDVRAKLAAMPKSVPPTVPATASTTPSQEITAEDGRVIPLERAKLVENRELSSVNNEILKSTVYYFCPVRRFQEACAKHNPPVQRLAVVLFETAKLLKKFRSLNAFYTKGSMLIYNHVHIGFAVDMGHGLKVLVVHEAESLGFTELADKVEDLLVKYATSSLAVRQITGSTFTVTDLAQTGAFTFEPLINSKQAAILGIGAESRFLGPNGDGFMLSCGFDHRLNTGRVVADFLAELSLRLAGHCESLNANLATESLCCSRCLQTVEELKAIQAFLIPSSEPPGYLCSNCLAGH
jgi:pyruvate/2-oxoglutarate dehydrogenase complex dihydrolipoamide acyltransferase (E2) component